MLLAVGRLAGMIQVGAAAPCRLDAWQLEGGLWQAPNKTGAGVLCTCRIEEVPGSRSLHSITW